MTTESRVLTHIATLTFGGTATGSFERVGFVNIVTDGATAAELEIRKKSGGDITGRIRVVGLDLSKEIDFEPSIGEKGIGTIFLTILGAGAVAYIWGDA